MWHHYRDIRGKLGAPQWHDEAGVPRYCEFSPRETNNIYADEVVLLEIACQQCGTIFKVCLSWTQLDLLDKIPSLASRIKKGTIHYGDPPNMGCCPAGPTMNSEPLEVLEFWQFQKDTATKERVHEYEGRLDSVLSS